ncbi:MAG: HAD-IA family hydrolase [Anaerolineae bacterium]|nr:HAD-IA family hydrolase [Anaerolineae bacterium]
MSRLHGIDAILFDFDGTLVQLNVDFARMRADVEALLPRYGFSAVEQTARYTLELVEEVARKLAARHGDGAAETFRREAHAAITAVEMDAANCARVHDGASALLQQLQRQGVKIAIVTRNCRAAVRRVMEQCPLPHDLLLTRDDVTAVKPDPAHLSAALCRLDVAPERALMVGDHPLDVRAGCAVGVRTVAVLTGYSSREQFAPELPDLILERVGELEKYLDDKTR